ncbi:MAG: DUF1905 domain-containing protein [Actinobacteria bacterium]|uniref:Unannotated protein n=1 Tax=freshwater metagenome TaxID=449393 RepID=A0A6J6EZE2_9ZZZZ|nr:DUF1905 domain-containing protein [Actinomycetota bacterium]MTA38693.1 DUF1905 domain-containing protein [Actinomycetota bacterium]
MSKFEFTGNVFEWRGPAPYYFIEIPVEQSVKIKESASQLTYGWGVIPVTGEIGDTEFTTSLIPKDGIYLLPIKNVVRLGEGLKVDLEVNVKLTLGKVQN